MSAIEARPSTNGTLNLDNPQTGHFHLSQSLIRTPLYIIIWDTLCSSEIVVTLFSFLFVCMFVCLLWVYRQINPPVGLDTPYRQLSWLYLTFINSWLLLNPYNLCADWRFGTAPLIKSLIDPRNILTILTLAATFYGGIFAISGSRRSQKVSVFALSLLVLPYLPASNLFFPVGFVVAERVLYLPSMGFCMLVGYGAYLVIKSTNYSVLKAFFSLFFLGLLSIHSLKTGLRNLDWVSEYSIFASAVRINPNHGPMLTNLGAVFVVDKSRKNYTHAEILFKHCVEVAPEYPRGLSNYAGLLEATKRRREAEKVYL